MSKRFIRKGSMLIFALTLIFSFSVTSFADVVNKDETYTTALFLNSHGTTTIKIHRILREYYTLNSSNLFQNIYTVHESYVDAFSSRPSWDTPYTMYVYPIYHVDSNGGFLRSFTMEYYSTIYPSDVWSHYAKKSTTSVTYPRFSNYKSKYQIQITAPQCLNPYVDTVSLTLN